MDIENYDKQMKKSINKLQDELKSLQIGKASTSILDTIEVYIPNWGLSQKLNQLANITVMDNQTLKVQPRDKSTIQPIEKSIMDSGIGLNPMNHGDHILINIPPLTQERREELKKYVHKMGEDYKVAIRNTRQDAQKEIKKEFEDKEISEDEKNNFMEELDNITKKNTSTIEKEVDNKSEEIMKV